MTDKSHKKRNAVIIGIAGAALLMGGSTYALWSVQGDITGVDIVAGSMNLEVNPTSYADVSEDISHTGLVTVEGVTAGFIELESLEGTSASDLDEWLIVPGDTIAITFPYQVTLKGDNLVAALTTTFSTDGTSSAAFSDSLKNLKFEYQLFNGDGSKVTDRATLVNEAVLYFDSAQNPTAGTTETVTTVHNDIAEGVVVVYVTFDYATSDKVDMDAILDFADSVTMELEQVRCGAFTDTKFDAICS
ncbi:MAG: hypothetical protein LBG99_08105 [Propionibacteriaceae bacterium]|jgi:alternate signal-mediated exported protein|nr:hypothetical protein [Propionibacteriaceae bacterium]